VGEIGELILIEVVGLKIGGSIATKKDDVKFSLDLAGIKKSASGYIIRKNVERIGKEVLQVAKKFSVFLAFGVGPFGHNLVRNRVDSAIVHESCSYYCERIRDILIEVGLPVVYEEKYSPYRLCEYKNGNLEVRKLTDWSFDMIKNNNIPLMHGDMVKLQDGKTTPTSADLLIPKIAIDLKKRFGDECKVKRILAATDIDGVFTCDPLLHEDAILIEKISARSRLNIRAECRGVDVTGRMPKKLESYQSAAREGIEGLIVNGFKENRIKDALLGKKVIGTLILP